MTDSIPVVDLDGQDAAAEIGNACRHHGFFYVVGHAVDEPLMRRLENLSRKFFRQVLQEKMTIRMSQGGKAWRGYFPVGDELTSGLPDQKEGIYFGAELSDDHPHVLAGTPLHGRNLFPAIADFRPTVLEYLNALTKLGRRLMELIASSLNLPKSYFVEWYAPEPLILFRIFHYPPLAAAGEMPLWSVGEHTDYGILTILKQDQTGGLQVKSRGTWIEAPPIENSFVCNIGDMLERMTGGLYRSTPHRVRNTGATGRLSFPFFFDPNFDFELHPIDSGAMPPLDGEQRWDKASVHDFHGTYGEYVLSKVSKVFPELSRDVL